MDDIFLSALTPLYSKWLASGLRRAFLALRFYYFPRLLRQVPQMDVYLAFDDPSSYLLVQTLPRLAQKYSIKINIIIVNDRQPGMNPEPKLWRKWALTDAKRSAKQYLLNAPVDYPDGKTVVTAMQMWQLVRPNINAAPEFFHQVWHLGFDIEFQHSTPVINHLIKNQQKQAALGHYASGTIFFAGHWYQGIERLDHLETALIAKGLHQNKEASVEFNQRDLLFVSPPAQAKQHLDEPESELVCYVSVRSPYSHLGLVQAQKLANHYGVNLVIKPVLPLKMRGLPVPKNKMIYLFLDTIREAKKLGIDYGNLCDPLGKGVIECYQVFAYAQSLGREAEFLLAVYDAVNAKALNIASPKVMRKLCQQIALDYEQALAYNDNHDWNIWADANLQEMEKLGFWGVPCFKFADTAVWGQDRLWQIEQAILKYQYKNDEQAS